MTANMNNAANYLNTIKSNGKETATVQGKIAQNSSDNLGVLLSKVFNKSQPDITWHQPRWTGDTSY